MKGSCVLVASVLAASTVALCSSSSSCDPEVTFSSCSKQESCHSLYCCSSPSAGKGKSEKSCTRRSAVTEKFAPRFDGLRFIETLVTAHR